MNKALTALCLLAFLLMFVPLPAAAQVGECTAREMARWNRALEPLLEAIDTLLNRMDRIGRDNLDMVIVDLDDLRQEWTMTTADLPSCTPMLVFNVRFSLYLDELLISSLFAMLDGETYQDLADQHSDTAHEYFQMALETLDDYSE